MKISQHPRNVNTIHNYMEANIDHQKYGVQANLASTIKIIINHGNNHTNNGETTLICRSPCNLNSMKDNHKHSLLHLILIAQACSIIKLNLDKNLPRYASNVFGNSGKDEKLVNALVTKYGSKDILAEMLRIAEIYKAKHKDNPILRWPFSTNEEAAKYDMDINTLIKVIKDHNAKVKNLGKRWKRRALHISKSMSIMHSIITNLAKICNELLANKNHIYQYGALASEFWMSLLNKEESKYSEIAASKYTILLQALIEALYNAPKLDTIPQEKWDYICKLLQDTCKLSDNLSEELDLCREFSILIEHTNTTSEAIENYDMLEIAYKHILNLASTDSTLNSSLFNRTTLINHDINIKELLKYPGLNSILDYLFYYSDLFSRSRTDSLESTSNQNLAAKL